MITQNLDNLFDGILTNKRYDIFNQITGGLKNYKIYNF